MTTKKEILFVHHVSSYGGASFCLLNIIRGIDLAAFDVKVLLKNEGPLVEELQKLNVKIIFEKTICAVPYNKPLFSFKTIIQWLRVFKSASRINNIFRNSSFEIIYLNTMMLHPYAKLAKKHQKKVVLHMREHWPKNQNKLQFYFAKHNIERYVDKIIAINKTSATILNFPNKTEIIYDYIDFSNRSETTNFKKLFGNNFRNLKIMLFLGGAQKNKGALEVLKSFKSLNNYSDLRLLFVMNNFKNNKYKIRLKNIINKVGIYSYSDKLNNIINSDNRIVRIPATNHVKDLIQNSFCILSYPTIPHAILTMGESILLNKPIISADTPEAREYSINGNAAVLFEMNNINDFKAKIIYTIENYDLVCSKTQNGFDYINTLFSKERNLNSLIKILKNI